ncbi:murein hydrolase activator EnvC family protein [Lichenibacterium dinghuense]|uniref:murein hydrolase activator EnvC family protein n=1 Tax=Lichenibacterium dinghuense TaxID=2895977 RepID=UPI001F1FD2C3|nr:peptidoglycan DD-metalloendopeptidase family protein [Lichenibacterium sp. 6Y81]
MRWAPLLGLIALAAPVAPGPLRAAEPAPAGQAAPDALADRKRRLQDALSAAAAAEADRRRTEGDLDAIKADRARLSAALVGTTARVREMEARSTAVEARLDLIAGREDALRRSLAARRGDTARVLAALQRLGLHPLPALLARPDDVMDAVRSATLLGAVVPELRSAARDLASDLAELGRLRSLAAGERDALGVETASLGAERARLDDLVAARQAAQAAAEGALDGERRRAAALAADATGLKDLVARLESDAAAAQRADEARRRAAEADAAGVAAKAAAAGGRDPARLTPATPFGDTRGRLTLPVVGRIVKAFGAADDYGGQSRGQSVAARPGAVVTAPADGWISFSGPYRSYGQLLIMTMGDGYYVVLAGLARIDVAPGQFVLAGEPLGAMGDGSVRAASAIALGAGDPVLYVEFRKDGAAIDPAPWWAKAESQKVRG